MPSTSSILQILMPFLFHLFALLRCCCNQVPFWTAYRLWVVIGLKTRGQHKLSRCWGKPTNINIKNNKYNISHPKLLKQPDLNYFMKSQESRPIWYLGECCSREREQRSLPMFFHKSQGPRKQPSVSVFKEQTEATQSNQSRKYPSPEPWRTLKERTQTLNYVQKQMNR